jgi:SAM-dependent methyltransferase
MKKQEISDFYNICWSNWNDFVRFYPASIHRRRFIFNQIKKIKDWNSLADLGCGNALLINILFKNFNKPTRKFSGLDVSPNQIEANRKNFPYISFDTLDLGAEIPQEKFDIITCSEVIEHIYDYKKAISNICKCLNPGGHVIVTVPKGEIFYTEQEFGHFRHFWEGQLIEEFEKNGVECIKCHAWGFPFHDLAKIIANINPRLSLKKFASGELSSISKLLFSITNIFYYLNFLPLGKQLYYVGRKKS